MGRFLACVLVLMALDSPALADKRVALVIGNTAYQHVQHLPNPANDAADIAAALERIGFVVRKETDLDFNGIRRALRDFGDEAAGADMAAIFFAGHGIEMDKQNFLIPVDAQLRNDRDVVLEAIPLDHFLTAVEGAKGLRLVLVDACRNNPFSASMKMTSATRAIGRGLSRVDPPGGIFVGFAAKEGTTASDGEGRNSPYAAALLAHLEQPGVEIRLLFGKVHDAVLAATGNTQEPFTYGALGGEAIYLVAPAEGQAHDDPPAPGQKIDKTARLTVDIDRSKFDIAARDGLFYARRAGVVVRSAPSLLAGGLETLAENTGYRALERFAEKAAEGEGVSWYRLDLGDGRVGFAHVADIYSEDGHKQKLVYDVEIPKLDKILAQAEAENSGSFARHWGIYSNNAGNCSTGMAGLQWLVWFQGKAMRAVILNDPGKIYDDRLRHVRAYKSTAGTINWYKFTDVTLAFFGGKLLTDPKFSSKRVNYTEMVKCPYPYLTISAIQENWRKIVAELPTEKEPEQQ